jgi:arabinofuranosyltransferase
LTARLAALAVFAALFIAGQYVLRGASLEDAYITYRYAENVARHGVFGYNPDDPIPTEGATSVAWVAAMIPGIYLFDDPLWWGKALGIAAAVAIAAVLARRAGWLAALVFLAIPATSVHAATGMETMATAWALCLLGLAHVDGRRGAVTAFAVAAYLIRPDTALFSLVLLVAGAWHPGDVEPGRVIPPLRRWAPLGAFAGVLLLTVLARLLYFHALVPNTYLVKRALGVYSPYGIRAMLNFVVWAAPLIAGAGLTLLLAWRARARVTYALVTLGVALAVYAAQWARFEPVMNYADRFLYPCLPLLIWLALVELPSAPRPRWVTPALAAVAVVVAIGLTWRTLPHFVGSGHAAAAQKTLGLSLRDVAPGATDRSISVTAAGAVPFFSRWRAIDALGLNDREIAARGVKAREPNSPSFVAIVDVDAVFRRRPAVILDSPGDSLFSVPFRNDPRFADYARAGRLSRPGLTLDVFVRSDWPHRGVLASALARAGVQR